VGAHLQSKESAKREAEIRAKYATYRAQIQAKYDEDHAAWLNGHTLWEKEMDEYKEKYHKELSNGRRSTGSSTASPSSRASATSNAAEPRPVRIALNR
jgi:hypothetical protein